jgi:hypothetical protein
VSSLHAGSMRVSGVGTIFLKRAFLFLESVTWTLWQRKTVGEMTRQRQQTKKGYL